MFSLTSVGYYLLWVHHPTDFQVPFCLESALTGCCLMCFSCARGVLPREREWWAAHHGFRSPGHQISVKTAPKSKCKAGVCSAIARDCDYSRSCWQTWWHWKTFGVKQTNNQASFGYQLDAEIRISGKLLESPSDCLSLKELSTSQSYPKPFHLPQMWAHTNAMSGHPSCTLHFSTDLKTQPPLNALPHISLFVLSVQYKTIFQGIYNFMVIKLYADYLKTNICQLKCC